MTLRTRLLIGYGYLVLLVIAVAVAATVGFFDLGGRIQTVLDRNVRSLESTTRLMETLERQDSATLSALLEGTAETAELEEANETFRQVLSEVRSRAGSEDEREIISQLDGHYSAYRQERQALLERQHQRPLAAYERTVLPKFQALKGNVQQLLELNQAAIVEADRQAQSEATRYGVAMAALVGVGLLSFLVLTRALQRRLLDRLAEINDVADAVSAGNLNRRVSIDHHDELGAVGRQLNRSLDRYTALERHVDGRLAEMKQNVLGMFDTFGIEGTLFNVDGRVVASTLELSSDEFPDGVRERIVEVGRELVEGYDREADEMASTTLELEDGTRVEIELVRTRGRRLVGWLARVAA